MGAESRTEPGEPMDVESVLVITPMQVGQVVRQSLGLGCYIAWAFSVWAGYSGDSSAFAAVSGSIASSSLFRELLAALCMVAIALASPSIRTLCLRPVVLFVFALIASVSCAGPALAHDAPMLGRLIGAAYIVGGIGFALRLGWEEFLSLQGVLHVTLCFAGGYLVGVVCFVAVTLLPADAVWMGFAAMPLLSWALLVGSVRKGRSDGWAKRANDRNVPGVAQTLATISWKLLVAIALVYVCYGAVRSSRLPFAASGDAGVLTDVVLTALVSIAAIGLGYALYRRNVLIAFYLAFPLLAVSSLLPPGIDPYMVGATFASALVAMVLWLLVVEFIVKDGLSALLCVALMKSAQLLGNLGGQWFADSLNAENATPIIVLLCAMGVLLILFGYQSPRSQPARFSGVGRLSEDAGGSDAMGERRNDAVERIASAVDRFGLTPREAEVLRIWAQGRAITYIERELFISKSTVKTHLTHIYAKTGTANREELLTLLDHLENETPR